MACTQVNLYQAKTQLSSLVDRAARGEEIIVAKAGEPVARLTPLAVVTALEQEPLPFGKNLPGITFLSVDWEDDLPLNSGIFQKMAYGLQRLRGSDESVTELDSFNRPDT